MKIHLIIITFVIVLAILGFGFLFLNPSQESETASDFEAPNGGGVYNKIFEDWVGRPDVVETVEDKDPREVMLARETIELLKSSGLATTSESGAVVHLTKTETTTGEEERKPYDIFFVDYDSSFQIVLLEQSIGKSRRTAESEFLSITGFTENEACTLRYQVVTTIYVDDKYGGSNLGFSFCPGSVILSEI